MLCILMCYSYQHDTEFFIEIKLLYSICILSTCKQQRLLLSYRRNETEFASREFLVTLPNPFEWLLVWQIFYHDAIGNWPFQRFGVPHTSNEVPADKRVN